MSTVSAKDRKGIYRIKPPGLTPPRGATGQEAAKPTGRGLIVRLGAVKVLQLRPIIH